ncbi:delta-like protein 1 [Uloborus diversus]|uniref:delta-like protein 1 n=1 Tax=Uloborus diversus TaxID=327109 RepID=UPI0024097D41|nr:delta-like protein 1 [Uloborus diversus]
MEVNLKSLVLWCALLFIGVYARGELDTRSEVDEVCGDYDEIDICQNGGKCIRTGKDSFCKCRKGTSGNLCETIDDCERKICGQGTGKDVFCMYDPRIDSAVCICKQKDLAFDRIEGECRRHCSTDDDCANGATCLQEGIGDKENIAVSPYDLKFCRCLPGTIGVKCETVLSCIKANDFCGKDSNATCYYDVKDKIAKCACPVANEVYDDVNKICKECTCGDKGENCTYKEGVKHCDCEEGFYDVGGTCKDCKCGPQATGCSYEDGKKICHCEEGFKQNGEVCENCNCRRNYKDCDFIDGEMTCTCEDGYAQKGDMCVEACSDDRPCKNGGSCKNGICTCKKGTGGNFCQIVTKCEYDNPCPQVYDIICAYDEEIEDAFCKCTAFDEVYVKDQKKCIKTCSDENPCENGGQCVDETEENCVNA